MMSWFTIIAVVVALSAVAKSDDEFIGHLESAKAKFSAGLMSVGPLSAALNVTDGQDVDFFNRVQNSTRTFEVGMFSQTLMAQYTRLMTSNFEEVSRMVH